MNKQTQEALKMAIRMLEGIEVVFLRDLSEHNPLKTNSIEAINACKEALEQPAQEPVAWMCTDNYDEVVFLSDKTCIECQPLYTHPHQWQGLTDDEAKKIIAEFEPLYDGYGMLCAIEQALKEKNENILE